MVKKLQKENQPLLLHNGVQDNQQAKQLMEMQMQETILIFSILDKVNVNKKIMEMSIGKLI